VCEREREKEREKERKREEKKRKIMERDSRIDEGSKKRVICSCADAKVAKRCHLPLDTAARLLEEPIIEWTCPKALRAVGADGGALGTASKRR
jgi:hypothetical protein